MSTMYVMYGFIFSEEKNSALKATRKVSFEMVIEAISDNRLLAILKHHNEEKYKGQGLFVVEINNYAYVVPFVRNIEKEEIFLKTIFASRKMTKTYLKGNVC